MNLIAGLWYRRAADTREVSSYFISIISIIFHFQYFTLISAARRYQGSVVIKFISFKWYWRPTNTVGIQRYRFVHLHFIGGLRCSVGGFELVGPVLSSAIGRTIPPIGGLSEHPLSHNSADTVASANTMPPRYALELMQLNCPDLSICVRSRISFANPRYSVSMKAPLSLSVHGFAKTKFSLLRSQHVNHCSPPSLSPTSLDPNSRDSYTSSSPQCTLELQIICA